MIEPVFSSSSGGVVRRVTLSREHECEHCGARTQWAFVAGKVGRAFCTILCFLRNRRRRAT